MLAGAFGDPGRILTALQTGNANDISRAIRPLTETLVSATPLIFTGLAISISFRAGMFNIGGDGQLLIGAMAATIAAIVLEGVLPSWLILIAAIGVATLAGAAWGFVPGFLKARTGAHEVITTIMLNYIGPLVVFFILTTTPGLRNPGNSTPVSKELTPIVDVPGDHQPPDHPAGLRVRRRPADGRRRLVAPVPDDERVRAARRRVQPDGGALCRHQRRRLDDAGDVPVGRAVPGWPAASSSSGRSASCRPTSSGGLGFNAIALALLAGLRPSGVVLSALLFGALTQGGKLMGIDTGIPFDLLLFIMALVIMFVAAPGLIRSIWRVQASASRRRRSRQRLHAESAGTL